MNNLRLGSLFDGSGGFPLAGLMANITPVWASEIEPFPIRVTTKRIPQMKHYGNIQNISGSTVENVDIITFGSPCQDLSLAGKRKGLDGARSSMFFEAIRIIKEMMEATDGKYPRWIVWENVPGALSSSKGEDFRTVIEEICKIKDETISIPMPEKKWNNVGEIMGEDYSLAYRILDAQFWGVPQRRRRIFLVADFRGQSAGKILFESESVFWDFKTKRSTWQKTASGTKTGFDRASTLCLNDQGGNRMDVTENMTSTLRASSNHPPCVINSPEQEVYENHSQDSRYKGPVEVAQTVVTSYGKGGNNQPFVVADKNCLDKAYSIQGSMIGRTIKNGPNGNGINSEISFTLNTVDRHAAVYAISREAYNCGRNYAKNITISNSGINSTLKGTGPDAVATPTYCSSKASFFTSAEKEKANTLVATDYKDPPFINDIDKNLRYTVRRLTPLECCRLQGFPDDWCEGLETENPTEEDIAYWSEVFETHRKAIGKSKKPKTRNQIIKWLKSPCSDSAMYSMWGNGVALPCVYYVLNGIVHSI